MNGREDGLGTTGEDDQFQQLGEQDEGFDVENQQLGEEENGEREDNEESEEKAGEEFTEEHDLEEGEKLEEGLGGASSQESLGFGTVVEEENIQPQEEFGEEGVPPPVQKASNPKLGEETRLGFMNDDEEERTFEDSEEKPKRRLIPLLIGGMAVLAIIVLTGVGIADATSSSSSSFAGGADNDGNSSITNPPSPAPTSEPSISPTAFNSTIPPVDSTSTPTLSPTSAENSTGVEGNQTSPPTGLNDTGVPTLAPTGLNDTGVPTLAPTGLNDTGVPTLAPTGLNDTGVPTLAPTGLNDTGVPTTAPTSSNETGVPTTAPTSSNETGVPTTAPTLLLNETEVPTASPIPSDETLAPTSSPTDDGQTLPPTDESVTDAPTDAPITSSPTPAPIASDDITGVPTYAPTEKYYPPWWPWRPKRTKPPTPAPEEGESTGLPTSSPTPQPSDGSSGQPTNSPTRAPTTGQPTGSPTPNPTVDTSASADYITVVFTDESNLSPGVRLAFEKAAERWSNILRNFEIVPDNVPAGFNFNSGAGCSLEQDVPVPVGPITGLTIAAEVVPIDGVGSVLGRAGFCGVFAAKANVANVFVPLIGQMTFDSADLAGLEANGSLESVILHEMGHVLGIGTLWNVNFLNFQPLIVNPVFTRNGATITANPGNSPEYIGANALAGFQQLGGGSGNILVEDGSFAALSDDAIRDGAGIGSIDSHWRETAFQNELMSPAINTGVDNPLSVMSIRSLEDLGYDVDVNFADSFVIPGTDPNLPLERNSGEKIDMDSDIFVPSDDVIRTGIDRVRRRALSLENGDTRPVSVFA